MTVKNLYKNKSIITEVPFNIEYGQISKEISQVTCLICKSYLTIEGKPTNVLEFINDAVLNFKKNLSKSVRASEFLDSFIFVYDFPKNVDDVVKNKILTIEIYLKQKIPLQDALKEDKLKELLIPNLRDFIKVLSNKFSLSKTKV